MSTGLKLHLRTSDDRMEVPGDPPVYVNHWEGDTAIDPSGESGRQGTTLKTHYEVRYWTKEHSRLGSEQAPRLENAR